MAIRCSRCGQLLPRDDARFCNQCGMLVPPALQELQSGGEAAHLPASFDGVPQNPPLQEQIAHQPVSRTSERKREEPPAWLERLGDNMVVRAPSPGPASERRPEPFVPNIGIGMGMRQPRPPLKTVEFPYPDPQPEPASASQEEPGSDFVTTAADVQEDFPAPSFPAPPGQPVRELRVKVWDHGDDSVPDSAIEEPAVEVKEPEAQVDAEYLPTQPLLDVVPGQPPVDQPTPTLEAAGSTQSVAQPVEQLDTIPQLPSATVEQLDTIPQLPSTPRVTPLLSGSQVYQPVRENTPLPLPVASEVSAREADDPQAAVTPTPAQYPQTPLPVGPSPQMTPRVSGAPSAARPTRRVRPLVFIGLVLAVLVIGLASWIVAAHPFAVPASTNPLVQYTNTQLGFSLMYPNAWNVTAPRGKALVQLYDSNHTDQITVSVMSAANNSPAQALQQQVSQLGMKNVQNLPATSLGGTSWQQIQGGLVQSGANYTGKLLAATHAGHLYLLMQFAPQVTFKDEESAVFSAVRASWLFL